MQQKIRLIPTSRIWCIFLELRTNTQTTPAPRPATRTPYPRCVGPPIIRNRNHRDSESISATVIKINTITYAT